MKVVSAETMQKIDQQAIREYGVPGLTLMENAGRCCVNEIIAAYGHGDGKRAVIVAGKGNNGGDGYVIARLLQESGWQVKVFVLSKREEIGGDAANNLARLAESLLTFCPDELAIRALSDECSRSTVVVDALLGTGLKSDVSGAYLDAIEIINGTGAPVVAVDIPSGIHGSTGKIMGTAVKADMTVTFAFAKLGHVLYPGAEFVGLLRVVDIGIPVEVMLSANGVEFLNLAAIRTYLRKRGRCQHKGSFGHCLIIAGSTGKTGAAAMAANSAVRAGAGLVTLAIPESLNSIVEVKTTEAMSLPLDDNGRGYLSDDNLAKCMDALNGKSSIALGPGISCQQETGRLIRRLVAEISLPMVLDADGLNAISENPEILLSKKTSALILTPHPGEMARLTGKTVADIEADRIGSARDFAVRYGVYLVLKGARTLVASPDGEIVVNGSGNPGMASGGMGDVLTGMIAALLGQGYSPFVACKLGVYVHGLAADQVADIKGEIGMSAVDVQERIPFAMKEIIG